MITPAHTQLVMSALSMINLSAHEHGTAQKQLETQVALFEAKAEVFKDLIGALVSRRVDAVKSGFSEVLGLYAEQARHFMSQQSQYADQELKATDPLERADLRKRLGEIDIELRRIRADARRIYTQMTRIVLELGGNSLSLAPEYFSTLSLPDLRA